MKHILFFYLNVFIAVALHCSSKVAGTTDETESGTRMYGRLYTYDGGAPLADAMVLLFAENDSIYTVDGVVYGGEPVDSALTDSDGYYQFSSVDIGTYNLVAVFVSSGDTLRSYRSGIDPRNIVSGNDRRQRFIYSLSDSPRYLYNSISEVRV